MGRGLSELQRHILREAGRLRYVFYTDVLIGFFGWEPKKPVVRWKGDASDEKDLVNFSTPAGMAGVIRNYGSPFFSPGKIGEKTYRKVMASLSRSFRRLADRRLVEWSYLTWGDMFPTPCVTITDEGRKWLTVNGSDNSKNVNRC